jgi:tetratricopeptide (TPR) repeat protein
VTEAELIVALRERLATTDATGDPSWFGTDEGATTIAALRQAAVGPDQTGTLEAFGVLGVANLCRFWATKAADLTALGAAVYFMVPIHAQAPRLVPEFLLPLFAGTAEPELAAVAGEGLAGFYLLHRYPQAPLMADQLLRYAVDRAATEALRGYCQSSLAVVLLQRSAGEPTATRELLTEAIGLCRAAVAAPDDDGDGGERTRRLANLGRMLISWAAQFDDDAAAAEGAAVTEQALARVTPGTPLHTVLSANLGEARMAQATVFGQRKMLPEAIDLLRRAVHQMPDTDPERSERMFTLGVSLAAASGMSGPFDAAGYREAIELIEAAIAAATADAARLRFTANLAYLRYGWGEQTGDADTLTLAESQARGVVDATADTHPLHAQAVFVLGEIHEARFNLWGDPAELDAAIDDGQRATDLTPRDSTHWVSRSMSLCGKLHLKGRDAEVVAIARPALAATAAGTVDRARVAFRLAVALEATQEPNDESLVLLRECQSLPAPEWRFPARVCWRLGRALVRRSPGSTEGAALLRSAIDLLPPGDSVRGDYLSSLGAVLADSDGLSEAVELARLAVAGATPGTTQEAGYRSNLGAALVTYGRQTSDIALIEEGVASHRAAVAGTRPGDFNLPLRRGNLGDALRVLSEFTSDTGQLGEAIEVLRETVAQTPADHPQRCETLNRLGTCLRARSQFDDDPVPLHEAERCLRESIELAAASGQPVFTARQHLANVLSDLADYTGDLSLRDEALGLLEAGVADAHDSEEQALALHALALNQWRRAMEEEDDALRETAIATMRNATAKLPPGHASRPTALMTLGGALLDRARAMNEQAWALEGAEFSRQALAACPERGAQRGMVLANLSGALRRAHEVTGDPALLAESIARATEAGSLGFGHPQARAQARLNLAIAQVAQDDYTAALETAEAGLAELAEGHPLRTTFLIDIALFCWMRLLRESGAGLLVGEYSQSSPAVLARGVAAAREALALAPDQATGQWVLAQLQLLLARRGSSVDLVATARLARSASLAETASVPIRLQAARTWGEAAALGGRDAEALDAYTRAVELLGQVAPRGMTRGGQEEELGVAFALASDAAAIALRTGDADRALALLELGRGVLLSQQLDARGDLSRLRDADPALAASFERLRDELSSVPFLLEADPNAASRATARHALARQWDPLVARIRSLPGMDGFLRSPAIAELRSAAADGPVVVVNVSRYRSDAILVTADRTDVVPLTGASPRAVLMRAVSLGPLIDRAYGAAGPDGIPLAVTALNQTLTWLWDTIAKPVLDRLGLRYTPDDGEPWPRLYWCPTGWLSFLPLHAAGRHDAVGASAVLDRAISSYTPTLRTLVRARSQGGGGFSAPLVVSLPQTPGGVSLPGAAAESALLARLFPSRTELAGPSATVASVAAALPRFSVVHFGCHGVSEPDRPSEAGLQLYDGRLRALDAAALRLPHAQLAVLAACATAQGAVTLPDEAIHVTSAFQMAGYPHVIGTLWPVSDKFSVQLAERFYTPLAAGLDADAGPAVPPDPAAALHHAIRDLRAALRPAPHLWAAHTHTGP